MTSFDPTLTGLRACLAAGSTPTTEIAAAVARLRDHGDPAVCLHLAPASAVGTGPLAGVALAVKDNIDVADMPTTAGCPSFSYQPAADAGTVARLRAAGAVPVAKTNLDQFATGLVGVRSPIGVPGNPLVPGRIPGGSSSGSAVAVSAGLVPVALGTDTAGSGRVPAAATGIVGLKPTKGWVSTAGVVPACRSLDCVTVFAHTVPDAWEVLTTMAGPDPTDAFSRMPAVVDPWDGPLRIGIPVATELDGVVDPAFLTVYRELLRRLQAQGHTVVEIDYAPFRQAADLLYQGASVAERTAAVGAHIAAGHGDLDPTVASIIAGGTRHTAVDAWRGTYALAALAKAAAIQWQAMDVLLLPTIAELPTIAQVQADPVARNSRLGRFTNFANLLDTCAAAVPAGHTPPTTDAPAGLPVGVTAFAPAWHDALVARLGAEIQALAAQPLGATGWPCPVAVLTAFARALPVLPHHAPRFDLAVFGAHLRGQPLNPRLVALGGRYRGDLTTSADYRFFALPGTPARPALVRVSEQGAAIAGERWSLPADGLGRLLAEIPAPLGLGRVRLAEGGDCLGFLGEAVATAPGSGAEDITRHGGWAAWRLTKR